jgi:hypothetical protein
VRAGGDPMSSADVSGIGHSYDHLPVDALPVDVAIDRYVPARIARWEEYRTIMTTVVKAAAPPSYEVAREMLFIGYAFIQWLVTIAAVPIDADRLFTERNLLRFVQQMPSKGKAFREGIQAKYLARLVKAHTGSRPKTGLPEGRKVANPYTRAQLASACSFANTRRTELQTRTLRTIVALGAGAGLSFIEMEAVRLRDLADDHVLVTVQRPRVVPLIPYWLDWIDRDPNGEPDDHLVMPGRPRLRKHGEKLRNFIKSVDDNPVDANRLRTTWVVSLIRAGIGAGEIRNMAGFKTFQALDNYIPFLPDIDPVALRDRIAQITPESTR